MADTATELRQLLPRISYWEAEFDGNFRVWTPGPANTNELVAQNVPYALVEQLDPKLPLIIFEVGEASIRNVVLGSQVMNTLMLLEGRDVRFTDTSDTANRLLAVYSLKRTVTRNDCLRIEGARIVTAHIYVMGERLTYARDVRLYNGTVTMEELVKSYPGFTERLHVGEELGLGPNELPTYVFSTAPDQDNKTTLPDVQFE